MIFACENGKLLFHFNDFTLDTDQRELRRGPKPMGGAASSI
jgi:hypothetical protein